MQGARGKKKVRSGGKLHKCRIDVAYACRAGSRKNEAGVYAG